MDKILYILLVVGIIGFFIYQVITNEKRRRAKVLRKIRQAWGMIPDREYEYDEFKSISRYYEKKKRQGEFFIDDITWNDLDMDSVFMAINNTQSSTGEEYLYKLLRTPVFEKETLEEREKVIQYFSNHEKERLEYQLDLSKVGRTNTRQNKISLVDYIYNFAELEKESNFGHYLQIALVFMSLILLLMNPAIGILAFIATLFYNVITYYRDKAKVEPYFVCIGAVVRLVKCSAMLGTHKEPELKEYTERLKKASLSLSSVIKDARYIGSTDKVSGDLTEVIMDYIRMIFHVDLIKFNSMLGKVQGHLDEIEVMMESIGFIESMIAIASYRLTLPFYCQPQLREGKSLILDATDLYHPMIKEPVANSISETRPVLLTGSNASGKSTFLKTVAINAVLSQTIHTALAHSYEGNFYRVYSSMALRDNLQGNESYYIVEIKSLKRILDAADGQHPVLCFVDEVLRGTNTVERIAASSRILQTLAQKGAMSFAATHDIELTSMLTDYYSNYHFEEEISDNDVKFNYMLFKGKAKTRNAIKLLSIMGYEKSVIHEAEETARRFLDEGIWSL
ncbi:MAG: MutS-related protein [Lachnospiraceae bacterium]